MQDKLLDSIIERHGGGETQRCVASQTNLHCEREAGHTGSHWCKVKRFYVEWYRLADGEVRMPNIHMEGDGRGSVDMTDVWSPRATKRLIQTPPAYLSSEGIAERARKARVDQIARHNAALAQANANADNQATSNTALAGHRGGTTNEDQQGPG